jgi:hypothetical protein
MDAAMADERDLGAIRGHLNRVADKVDAHEGTLREHAVLMTVNAHSIEAMRATVATQDQLEGAVAGVTGKLETFHLENRLTNKNMESKLDAIQSGITWVVRLVIGAVILAVIGYLLQHQQDEKKTGHSLDIRPVAAWVTSLHGTAPNS